VGGRRPLRRVGLTDSRFSATFQRKNATAAPRRGTPREPHVAKPTREVARMPSPPPALRYSAFEERELRGMPAVTIVYWRDIPAQVIVKAGRKAAKRPLPERFEQAIDRCAMKVGAKDSDAYLAEWRRGEPVEAEGDLETLADAEAARLVAAFDTETIKALIANDGWADGRV
jgi:hypothetical protein